MDLLKKHVNQCLGNWSPLLTLIPERQFVCGDNFSQTDISDQCDKSQLSVGVVRYIRIFTE